MFDQCNISICKWTIYQYVNPMPGEAKCTLLLYVLGTCIVHVMYSANGETVQTYKLVQYEYNHSKFQSTALQC